MAKPKLHNELRQLWKDAGYHTRMGSVAVVPPPSSSYKRLYHLTTAEYAISDIVFSRLKVAQVDQLNDPFELLAPRFLHNRDLKTAVRKYKEKLATKHGLLCFSNDWTDPVLWTHYGARHTGICLGFDVPVNLAAEVVYQQDRIEVDGGTIDKRLEEKLLRTKYESWRYEHEWRVPVVLEDAEKEGEFYFEKIGNRIHLAEVVLGVLCINSVNEVRNVVGKHHGDVVTFQARLANGSFQIVPHETTIPIKAVRRHVR